MIGISLGTAAAAGHGAPVPDVQAIFGTLTKAGAGGVPVSGTAVVGGDPLGHWTISAGRIAPSATGSAAGLDAGPYDLMLDDGTSVHITTEPDAFAVADTAELQAISTSEGRGRTIRIREGAEISWSGPGFPGYRASLGQARIVGDGVALSGVSAPFHFATLFPDNLRDARFENIRARHARPYSEAAQGHAGNLLFARCHFGDGTMDPNGDYSAPGAFAAAGGHDAFETSGDAVQGISLQDCAFMGCGYGIQIRFDRWAEIIGNHIDTFYYDAIQITKESPDAPLIIGGNSITRPFGDAADADNPHADGIQIQGTGAGANIPDHSHNNVIEANAFSVGNTRINTDNQVTVKGYSAGTFLKNIAADKGFSAVVRGMMSTTLGYNDVRVTNAKDAIVEYCGTVPKPGETPPVNPAISRMSLGETLVLGNGNLMRANIADTVAPGPGVSNQDNLQTEGWQAGDWNATLPGWQLPQQDSYTLGDILPAFVVSAGAAAGKGPGALVSLAPGAPQSAYQLDDALAPQPVLANPLASAAGGIMSCAVSTNVSHNPIFWAVVPAGTATSDVREIKERRIAGALEYGHTAVTIPGSVTLQGAVAHPQGTYDVVMFQENGWTKRSGVVSTSFTVSTLNLTVNDLPRDKMVIDARIGQAGGGQAKVALSGTASPGEIVQAFDRGANTWQDIATSDGSGNWSGTLLATNDDGAWQAAQVRLKSDTTITAQTTNTFAPGTVFLMFGQSELDYMMSAFGGSSMPGPITVSDPDALQVLRIDNDEAANPQTVHHFITSDTSLTRAIAVLSNVLSAHTPGRKYLYVDGHHEGTGRYELMNDALNDPVTGRRWSVLQQVVDWVRNNGSEIGILHEMWFVADMATQPFLDQWAPFYFGQYVTGNTFTLGTAHTSGTVDHCLWDFDAPADQRGRGLFSRADTRLVQAPPLPYIPNADILVSTDDAGSNTHADLRQGYVDFHADTRTQEIAPAGLMPWTHPLMGRLDNTGTDWISDRHPNQGSTEGTKLMTEGFARNLLIAQGALTAPPATFSISAVDPSGAFVDVQLSGTGTLTTRRAQAGETPPTGEAHYTGLAGFEIRQGGAWSASGFTAAIQDAANRIIRITPTTAFANNDAIRFGAGGASGFYKPLVDGQNEVSKDWPLLDPGWTAAPGIWAEPMPRSAEMVITGLPVSGTVTYVNQNTNTVRALATDMATADLDKLTLAFSATSAYPATYGLPLANVSSSVRIYNNGNIRCVFKNTAGTVVFNQTWTGAADLTTRKHVLLVVDVAKGVAKLWVDGVDLGTKPITQNFNLHTAPRLFATSSGGASCGFTEISQVYVDPSAQVDIGGPAEAADVAKFYANGAPVYDLPPGHIVLGEDMTLAEWNNGVNRGTGGTLIVTGQYT